MLTVPPCRNIISYKFSNTSDWERFLFYQLPTINVFTIVMLQTFKSIQPGEWSSNVPFKISMEAQGPQIKPRPNSNKLWLTNFRFTWIQVSGTELTHTSGKWCVLSNDIVSSPDFFHCLVDWHWRISCKQHQDQYRIQHCQRWLWMFHQRNPLQRHIWNFKSHILRLYIKQI